MSTCEYYDMFLKCQNTGKYQVFTFDIVNSKLLSPDKRKHVQTKMVVLAELLYSHIFQLAEQTNTKILVFEKDFQYLKDNRKQVGFGLKTEPFILGDMFGFTIYRDSIDKSFIIDLFTKLKNELDIDVDFHINTGYYETNDYRLGNELFFRGYCIDLVSNFHKEKNKHLLKKLNK